MSRASYTAEQRAKKAARIAHLLARHCSYCNAKAGEFCRTNSNLEILAIGQMHEARLLSPHVRRRRGYP